MHMIWAWLLSSLCVICASYDLISTTIDLGLHDLQIPRLGLGTAGLRSTTTKSVIYSLQQGFRLIDTAQAQEWYDEQGVGDGITEFMSSHHLNHEELFILTKVHPRSYEQFRILKAIEHSKMTLYPNSMQPVPFVHAILLHAPYCWEGHCSEIEESFRWQEAWRLLEHSKSAGHIGVIGVSNFDVNLLKELKSFTNSPISIIQNWMDPFHQDRSVREYSQQHNIVYMAYSAFGTQWDWRMQGRNPVLDSPVLREIAAKHGVSVPMVVTSWALQLGVVIIPRSSSEDHLSELAQFFEFADDGYLMGVKTFLDHEDMNDILALDGALDE